MVLDIIIIILLVVDVVLSLDIRRTSKKLAGQAKDAVRLIWDDLLQETIDKLTTPDIIAEALSQMSREQLASLAEVVEAKRGKNG